MFKSAIKIFIFLFVFSCCFNATAKKHHGRSSVKVTKTVKKTYKKKYTTRKQTRYQNVTTPLQLDTSRDPLKAVYITSHSLPNSQTQAAVNWQNLDFAKTSSFVDSNQALDNKNVAFDTVFGQIDWPTVSKNMYVKNGKIFSTYRGYTLELTLDPNLQDAAQRYLKRNGVINGATAIIDPKTGRILALTQNKDGNSFVTPVASRAPAASLIKFITAAAAIEKQNLSPSDEIRFRGGCHSLPHNENWIANPAKDNERISFAMAFGSSCNAVFARLAVYDAGLTGLKTYSKKFMFNEPIPSDLKIQTSLFLLPDAQTATTQEVAEAGSGFGATKITALHSALLSAAVENNGVMMAPYLVAAAFDSTGKAIYQAKSREVGQVVRPQTAKKLETLMLATVAHGTSRRMFYRKGTRNEVDEIGGKTGTLLDLEDRDVLYTLFSGVAPLHSPNSIAIGTVIASPQNLVVRASSVAQTTLAEFLKLEKAKAE